MGLPSIRPSFLNFQMFDIFSDTTERNLTKLDRKQEHNVLYQVCVFQADWKTKMVTLSDLSTKVSHYTQMHDMWPLESVIYFVADRGGGGVSQTHVYFLSAFESIQQNYTFLHLWCCPFFYHREGIDIFFQSSQRRFSKDIEEGDRIIMADTRYDSPGKNIKLFQISRVSALVRICLLSSLLQVEWRVIETAHFVIRRDSFCLSIHYWCVPHKTRILIQFMWFLAFFFRK